MWYSNFKKSVAFKWLISYTVILLIPIMISTVIYVQTGNIVKYEIKRADTALLNQVKLSVDSGLLQTEKLANQLSIQEDIRKYINLKPNNEPFNSFSVYEAEKKLRNYSFNTDFIKDIYVYSKSLNKVLTPDTFVANEPFYQMYLENSSFTYEDWEAFAIERRVRGYYLLPTLDQGFANITAAFVQPLPKDDSENSSGMLIMMLNNNKIQQVLKGIEWIQDGQMFILNQKNEKVFYTDDGELPASIHYHVLEQMKDEPYNVTIQNQEMVISSVSSDISDWKYVSVIPAKVFWQRAEHLRNLNLLGLLICFLVGAVIIVFLIRNNYNPIQRLVRFVSAGTITAVGLDTKEQGEYQMIRQSFINTIRERDDVTSKHLQHIPILRNYFIAGLLKGQQQREQQLKEALKTNQIKWCSDLFVVLLFHVQREQDSSDDLQLMQFVISNVVQELNYHHTLYFTDIDGTLAALMNIDPAGTDRWQDDLDESLEEATAFIQNKYHFQFAVAISNMQRGIAGIHQAYIQALEALEYTLFLGEDNVIWYGDIKSASNNFTYTLNQEIILINLLKSGDFDNAKETLMDFLENSFCQGQPSLEMLKGMMIDMVNTLIKTLQDIEKDDTVWEKLRPVSRLFRCNTKKEIEVEFLNIFQHVQLYMESKNEASSTTAIDDRVAEFVHNHYTDPNLSVSMIASHFSITAQYLSKLFKEQSGQGLHEYITQTRVDAAKRLLLEGKNIEHAALEVGFASSSAFIRVFKKYEGVTPGKYKLINEIF